jgi:hypothetical protein
VLVHSDAGNAGVFLYDLADALSGATVYRLITGPTPDRFGILIVRGGLDVGYFEVPDVEMTGVPKLAAVKGETTPSKIAAALGVPPALLGIGP